MKYFTGIDVSLRSVSICVVDEAGAVQYEGKVPAEVDLIVASLRRVSLEIRQLGLEAGTLTRYLTYGLQKAGYEVICLEARQTAATLAAMRNKTDRNDACGLAQILRSGWYRTGRTWTPPVLPRRCVYPSRADGQCEPDSQSQSARPSSTHRRVRAGQLLLKQVRRTGASNRHS